MTYPRQPKMKLIALEEHFLHAEVTAQLDLVDQALLSPTRVPGLDELGDARIKVMDDAGIAVQVLSHTKPGVQEISDTKLATSLAISANDYLAEAVAAYPNRFAGFATLATAAPDQAVRELERTVQQFGFKGAMINGHTQGEYLDQQRFWPIFEAAEALALWVGVVPMELHSLTFQQLQGLTGRTVVRAGEQQMQRRQILLIGDF